MIMVISVEKNNSSRIVIYHLYSIRQKLYRRPLVTANLKFSRVIIILIIRNYAIIDDSMYVYLFMNEALQKNPGFTSLKRKKKKEG